MKELLSLYVTELGHGQSGPWLGWTQDSLDPGRPWPRLVWTHICLDAGQSWPWLALDPVNHQCGHWPFWALVGLESDQSWPSLIWTKIILEPRLFSSLFSLDPGCSGPCRSRSRPSGPRSPLFWTQVCLDLGRFGSLSNSYFYAQIVLESGWFFSLLGLDHYQSGPWLVWALISLNPG